MEITKGIRKKHLFYIYSLVQPHIIKLSDSEKMENMSHFIYDEGYFLHFTLSFSKTIYSSKAII